MIRSIALLDAFAAASVAAQPVLPVKIILMSFCPMPAGMKSPALPIRGISTLIWPTILPVSSRSLAWRHL